MSTHLHPLQLCLMIWAEVEPREAMFRERESRVTMETRLQVQPCREYWICFSPRICVCVYESVTQWTRHQKTPINISGLLRKRGRCIPPDSASVRRVRVLTQHNPATAWKTLTFPSDSPKLHASCQNSLGKERVEVHARRCVRARVSPTAAPGLHLIRPLFLSCPNRQALWVMNISQAAFQQQQVSVSVPVSSQWLWSAVLLHPKGVCGRTRKLWGKCG